MLTVSLVKSRVEGKEGVYASFILSSQFLFTPRRRILHLHQHLKEESSFFFAYSIFLSCEEGMNGQETNKPTEKTRGEQSAEKLLVFFFFLSLSF